MISPFDFGFMDCSKAMSVETFEMDVGKGLLNDFHLRTLNEQEDVWSLVPPCLQGKREATVHSFVSPRKKKRESSPMSLQGTGQEVQGGWAGEERGWVISF